MNKPSAKKKAKNAEKTFPRTAEAAQPQVSLTLSKRYRTPEVKGIENRGGWTQSSILSVLRTRT